MTVWYDAPVDPLEERLANTFAQVLQLTQVGRADNFFALGGDSIGAMQVVARLVESLGMEVPPEALFHHPTPAALALDPARIQRDQDEDIDGLAAELQELPLHEAARLLRRGSGEDA